MAVLETAQITFGGACIKNLQCVRNVENISRTWFIVERGAAKTKIMKNILLWPVLMPWVIETDCCSHGDLHFAILAVN